MPKSYEDFESKKTIHFNITREAHSKLRIACFTHRLSMQEVFENFAQKIAAQTPDAVDFLEDLSFKKRKKVISKMSKADASSLYDIIENDNPLNKDDIG